MIQCESANAKPSTTFRKQTEFSNTNSIRKVVCIYDSTHHTVLKHVVGSSGSPVFNSTGKVIGIHSGYGIARGSHRKGQTINVGVIINDRDNNINAFRAVLRFMAGEGMRGVLVRQMGHNTTRYTVMEV